jgi:hypothetical protein
MGLGREKDVTKIPQHPRFSGEKRGKVEGNVTDFRSAEIGVERKGYQLNRGEVSKG